MTKTTSETNKASTTTNANKRRKRVAMRFFTYGAMAVATVIGVIICIGWAMGYRFDLQNGLSQVALLQFNTFPTGASVDVNDERLTARTPTRSNVKTGETTVRMSRSGYRDWRKTVAALPSTVRWLDYVRLVPQNVRTESVHTFASVDGMLQSPDRKWALVLTDDKSGAMTLINLSNPEELKYEDVKLDGEQVSSDGEQEYELLEWDNASYLSGIMPRATS